MNKKINSFIKISNKAMLFTYLSFIVIFIGMIFLLVASATNSSFTDKPFYIISIIFLSLGLLSYFFVTIIFFKKIKSEMNDLDVLKKEFLSLLKMIYIAPLYVWKKIIKVSYSLLKTIDDECFNIENKNTNNKNHILETERLVLRHFEEKDLETVYDYRNNEDVNKFQVYDSFKKKDILKMFQENKDNTLYSETSLFAIALKETDQIIGEFYISNSDNKKEAFLGFTIEPNNQRKGYAYEMISEIIVEIVTNGKIKKLLCTVYEQNSKSINLIEKLEFVKKGITMGEKGKILIYEKEF